MIAELFLAATEAAAGASFNCRIDLDALRRRYAAKLAAARKALNPLEIAAAMRPIREEQAEAVRSVLEKRDAAKAALTSRHARRCFRRVEGSQPNSEPRLRFHALPGGQPSGAILQNHQTIPWYRPPLREDRLQLPGGLTPRLRPRLAQMTTRPSVCRGTARTRTPLRRRVPTPNFGEGESRPMYGSPAS